MADLPDWTRAVLLQGHDAAGNVVTILVGDDGQLYALLAAQDETGVVRVVKCDTSGQLVIVPRGAEGNYLSVSADGFLTAVLKGQRDGVLTTIGVDDEGRIEAFILDAESQWGDTLKTGNSELAARMGALKCWDWRGQVAWQSDFALGMGNVLKYLAGAGASITMDCAYWLTGGYSVKLVGGSDGDHKAYMDFLVEAPVSLDIGLEAVFSYVLDMEFFKIEVRCYTGGKVYTAAVRLLDSTNYIQYLNSTNVWTNVADSDYLPGAQNFHRLKLVADFSAAKYKRVLYANAEADLSAQSIYQSGTGYLSSLYVQIELNSRSGHNDVAYLDSLILTTKEPD